MVFDEHSPLPPSDGDEDPERQTPVDEWPSGLTIAGLALAVTLIVNALQSGDAKQAATPRRCLSLDNDAARLTCYDEAMRYALKRPVRGALAPASAEDGGSTIRDGGHD